MIMTSNVCLFLTILANKCTVRSMVIFLYIFFFLLYTLSCVSITFLKNHKHLTSFLTRDVWRPRVALTEATIPEWNDICTTSGTRWICCHTFCLLLLCLCVIFTLMKRLPLQDACLPCLCWSCIWGSWKRFWFTENWDLRLSW